MTKSRRRWIFPRGRLPGLMPRETKYGECGAKYEDVARVITSREEIEHLISEKVSMIPHVKHIHDQGSVGSCASESGSQGVMMMEAWNSRPFRKYNPWSIHCHVSGQKNRGASLDSVLRHCRDIGILPMDVWGRDKGYRTKPPQRLYDEHGVRILEFLDIGSLAELRSAAVSPYPIIFGHDSHAEVIAELTSWDKMEVVNSWGIDFGRDGIHTMRLSEVDLKRYGCWALMTATDSGATP